MSSKAKFAYSATADNARVAEYLTRIAEGLMAGSISLTADDKKINLAPSEVVKLTVEADSNAGKGRGSLILEVSWKADTEKTQSTLEISTHPISEDITAVFEPNPAGALGE